MAKLKTSITPSSNLWSSLMNHQIDPSRLSLIDQNANELPEKGWEEKSFLTIRDVISVQYDAILQYKKKGYTIEEIAGFLTQILDAQISPRTLSNYLTQERSRRKYQKKGRSRATTVSSGKALAVIPLKRQSKKSQSNLSSSLLAEGTEEERLENKVEQQPEEAVIAQPQSSESSQSKSRFNPWLTSDRL